MSVTMSSDEVVEALAAGPARRPPDGPGTARRAPACRGRAGPGRRRCAVRRLLHSREPNRRAPGTAGTVGGVSPARRCSRTACGRTRGHDADLRVRRPDGGARSARDVRRATCLRPVRRPQRAAVRSARLGGAAARAGPCGARAHQRRPAGPRRRGARGGPAGSRREPGARGARPAARSPAAATCGCSPPTDRTTGPRGARLPPWPTTRSDDAGGDLQGVRRARHRARPDRRGPRRGASAAPSCEVVDADDRRGRATTCGPARRAWPEPSPRARRPPGPTWS